MSFRDDEIVEPTLGIDVPAQHLGDLGVRRIAEHPVAEITVGKRPTEAAQVSAATGVLCPVRQRPL